MLRSLAYFLIAMGILGGAWLAFKQVSCPGAISCPSPGWNGEAIGSTLPLGKVSEPVVPSASSLKGVIPERLPGPVGQFVLTEALTFGQNGTLILRALGHSPASGEVFLEAVANADGEWHLTQVALPGQYLFPVAEDLDVMSADLAQLLNRPVERLRSNGVAHLIHFPYTGIEDLSWAHQRLMDQFTEEELGPNSVVFPAATPDDPEYGNSWTLAKLQLEAVWEVFGFSPEGPLGRRPIIAIVDNGASLRDPDLHFWLNEDEIPGNGLDDDGNGHIDDLHGYNFADLKPQLDFAGGHGSTVTRIAASLTNNGIGTASPATSPAVMNLIYYKQFLGNHFDTLDAILYAVQNRADVINCSFVSSSSTGYAYLFRQAAEQGIVIVAAAGGGGTDVIRSSLFPVNLNSPNLIGVGASNRQDLPENSNFSVTHVDLFAPETATSYATPLVSSTVALLRMLKPEADPVELIEAIRAGVDPVDALAGKCVSGGRLNVKGAVEALLEIDLENFQPPLPPAAPELAVEGIGLDHVVLRLEMDELTEGVRIEISELGGPYLPLEPTPVLLPGTSDIQVEMLEPGGAYRFRAQAFAGAAVSPWFETELIRTLEPPPPLVPLHDWGFVEPQDEQVSDAGSHPLPLVLPPAESRSGIVIPNTPTLNLSEIAALSLCAWVQVNEDAPASSSVLFEQGGFWRGLNILLDRGWLVASAWNRPATESNWSGTLLQGPRLVPGQWHHVALTFSASGLESDRSGLALYLDGILVASGPAHLLYPQFDANGIGQVQGTTVFRGRQVMQLDPFPGTISRIQVFAETLSPEQILEIMSANSF